MTFEDLYKQNVTSIIRWYWKLFIKKLESSFQMWSRNKMYCILACAGISSTFVFTYQSNEWWYYWLSHLMRYQWILIGCF